MAKIPASTSTPNSSAPISGVEVCLEAPSISILIPVIGEPKLSIAKFPTCKSVVEV